LGQSLAYVIKIDLICQINSKYAQSKQNITGASVNFSSQERASEVHQISVGDIRKYRQNRISIFRFDKRIGI
jgi:hypothetical protein